MHSVSGRLHIIGIVGNFFIAKRKKMLLVLLISFLCLTAGMGEELKCSSFDFEKKLLEMLVRIEFKLDGEIKTREENERQIVERIDLLKATDGQFKATDQQLEAKSQEILDTMTETVRKELHDVEGSVRALEARVTDVDHFQAYSNMTLKQLKATDEQLKATDEQLKATNKQLTATDQQLMATDQEILANLTVPPVYFLVRYATSQLHEGRPIFSLTTHNVGDSYDVSTGLFTCRVPGLYNFAFSYVSKSDSEHSSCNMRRNGGTVLYGYGKGDQDSSSIVGYMYMAVGDTVEVVCSGWEMVNHASTGTNFSGALIRK